MTLEIPTSVVLANGSVAQVKRVSASVTEGSLSEIVYAVELPSGAWAEVAAEDVRRQEAE